MKSLSAGEYIYIFFIFVFELLVFFFEVRTPLHFVAPRCKQGFQVAKGAGLGVYKEGSIGPQHPKTSVDYTCPPQPTPLHLCMVDVKS